MRLLLLLGVAVAAQLAATAAPDTSAGDRMMADYFRRETEQIGRASLAEIRTADDWKRSEPELRRELQEMLGLWPLPPRTPLQPVITGRVERDDFRVERLHFQSRPGLYVTGSLYLPKDTSRPSPAVLYVCGHGNVKKDGISYGSKASYQHHGAWFARNGYVCLVIDTLQLGEIEGLHHGTYREKMWWWISRGYTPGGVEAWNSIRALDYLQSRPEVDPERLGVTGRSGGGAYSWYLAALDTRIKAAVPVAGITDLQNHVVDGTVEGHCDCMFVANTFRWDYDRLAALVAPRPLLISNTDKDGIFPLEGVVRIHASVRRIYDLLKAGDRLGLLITEGPHKDTQDLQVPAMRWFNRFLKNDPDSQVTNQAVKLLQPEDLRVFEKLPADQINTVIHERFVPRAPSPQPVSGADDWNARREGWIKALRERVFRGWPAGVAPAAPREAWAAEHQEIRLQAFDFESQPGVTLRLYVAMRAGLKQPQIVVLNVLDDAGWERWLREWSGGFAAELQPVTGGRSLTPDAVAFRQTVEMLQKQPWAMAYVTPRGVGPTAWDSSERKQVQVRRRFMLLGQSLEAMQVWDIRRSVQLLRAAVPSTPGLWLQGEKATAALCLYASLFEPGLGRLDLWELPTTHDQGPALPNILKHLDMPVALALATEKTRTILYNTEPQSWRFATEVATRLNWGEKQLQFRRTAQ